MDTKESWIVNDKVMITVKNQKSPKLYLVTTSEALKRVIGRQENIKQIAKTILTAVVIIYNIL